MDWDHGGVDIRLAHGALNIKVFLELEKQE